MKKIGFLETGAGEHFLESVLVLYILSKIPGKIFKEYSLAAVVNAVQDLLNVKFLLS